MSRQREWKSSRQRAYQAAHRAAGLCLNCPRESGGNRLCDRCRAKQRKRNHARYGTKPWRKGKPGRPPIGAKI